MLYVLAFIRTIQRELENEFGVNGSVTGSLRAFWHPVSSCMPRVSWEFIKTLTNVLRFPNIVSNTISMMSRKLEQRRDTLTADNRTGVDDTNPPPSKRPKRPVPRIESHWTFEDGGYPTFPPLRLVLRVIFQFLCLISFGHKNLGPIWAACYRGCEEEDWNKRRDAIRERLEHVNVVVRLQ